MIDVTYAGSGLATIRLSITLSNYRLPLIDRTCSATSPQNPRNKYWIIIMMMIIIIIIIITTS